MIKVLNIVIYQDTSQVCVTTLNNLGRPKLIETNQSLNENTLIIDGKKQIKANLGKYNSITVQMFNED